MCLQVGNVLSTVVLNLKVAKYGSMLQRLRVYMSVSVVSV